MYSLAAHTWAKIIGEQIAKRMKVKVTIINPFAGIGSTLDEAIMDHAAHLPSPYTLAWLCSSCNQVLTSCAKFVLVELPSGKMDSCKCRSLCCPSDCCYRTARYSQWETRNIT